jgi:hypothetical protein
MLINGTGEILSKPIKRRLIEQQGGGKSKFTFDERTQRNTRISLGELGSCGYKIGVRTRWKDLTILGGALFGSGRCHCHGAKGLFECRLECTFGLFTVITTTGLPPYLHTHRSTIIDAVWAYVQRLCRLIQWEHKMEWARDIRDMLVL